MGERGDGGGKNERRGVGEMEVEGKSRGEGVKKNLYRGCI